LTPVDLLVAAEPHGSPWGGGLDALALDPAGRGLGLPPLPPALPLAQLLQQVGPQACPPPRAEVPIDRIPVAKIYRQHAPLAATLRDVENAIEHAPQLIGLAAGPTRMPFGLRQQRREQLPLLIGGICWIVPPGAHRRSSFPFRGCVKRSVTP